MDESLTFANGLVVEGHCLEMDDRIFLYMNGISFEDAIELLLNHENYETITAFRFGAEKVITGFNHFYYISEERDQMISAGIKHVRPERINDGTDAD